MHAQGNKTSKLNFISVQKEMTTKLLKKKRQTNKQTTKIQCSIGRHKKRVECKQYRKTTIKRTD